MLTNLKLTDMETCYKVFRREVVQSINLKSDRFGFEPECTAKIARGKWRVYEVPISYAGRTYAEGKKITWRDGFTTLWCILRYNLLIRLRHLSVGCALSISANFRALRHETSTLSAKIQRVQVEQERPA